METAIAYIFRFMLYALLGLTLEMVFSVIGIERSLGYRLKRRVPRKYLEGFVSLYMIPLHGAGVLFLFEPVRAAISGWFIGLRFLAYAFLISFMEVAWGWFLVKVVGFYPWDYYAESKYRVFKRGYTLWTLVPQWGIAGLLLEVYSDLLIELSPHVVTFFGY